MSNPNRWDSRSPRTSGAWIRARAVNNPSAFLPHPAVHNPSTNLWKGAYAPREPHATSTPPPTEVNDDPAWLRSLSAPSTIVASPEAFAQPVDAPHTLPPFLTVDEVGAFLCVDRKTIYDAIHSRSLPARRISPRRLRILRSELLHWLAEGPRPRRRLPRSRRSRGSSWRIVRRRTSGRARCGRSGRSIGCIFWLTLGGGSSMRLGAREIEGYKATRVRAGRSAKTINNELTVLRKTLAVARDWGLIEHVPVLRWMRTPAPEFDFLTAEEEGARLVRAAAPG